MVHFKDNSFWIICLNIPTFFCIFHCIYTKPINPTSETSQIFCQIDFPTGLWPWGFHAISHFEQATVLQAAFFSAPLHPPWGQSLSNSLETLNAQPLFWEWLCSSFMLPPELILLMYSLEYIFYLCIPWKSFLKQHGM